MCSSLISAACSVCAPPWDTQAIVSDFNCHQGGCDRGLLGHASSASPRHIGSIVSQTRWRLYSTQPAVTIVSAFQSKPCLCCFTETPTVHHCESKQYQQSGTASLLRDDHVMHVPTSLTPPRLLPLAAPIRTQLAPTNLPRPQSPRCPRQNGVQLCTL
jgi:hypothetical protein